MMLRLAYWVAMLCGGLTLADAVAHMAPFAGLLGVRDDTSRQIVVAAFVLAYLGVVVRLNADCARGAARRRRPPQ